MNKKLIAIFVACIFLATMFGAISASAKTVFKNQDVSPNTVEDIGGIGAFVFYEKPRLFSPLPRIIPVEGATVTCIDSEGETHEMQYTEVEPDFWAYMVYDLPLGPCQITATKSGFGSGTVDGHIVTNGEDIYKIRLDKDPNARPVIAKLSMLFPNLFRIFAIFQQF